MSVEVERKFVCSPDIKDKLRQMGAVSAGQCHFEDKYFDSPDYRLTLRDVWLRCRQGSWELKCPVQETVGKTQGGDLCSQYREITSLPEIIAKVRALLKRHDNKAPSNEQAKEGSAGRNTEDAGASNEERGDAPCRSDQAWQSELNLAPFAVFTTQRCKFLFRGVSDEGTVHVDLDETNFGFCVGEIEVLVPDGGDVQSALEKIERTAQKLGLSDDKKIPGKMEVYLQRFCPDHYTKLLDANVL